MQLTEFDLLILAILYALVRVFPLQEAENTLRMMQHKLREEERDLMKSSCETINQTHCESEAIVT